MNVLFDIFADKIRREVIFANVRCRKRICNDY